MILELFPSGTFFTLSIIKHLINYLKVKNFPRYNILLPMLSGVLETLISCLFKVAPQEYFP